MQTYGALAVIIGIPLYVAGSWFVSHLPHAARAAPRSVTVSFVGDIMFDRYIRERAETVGYDEIVHDTLPLFASSSAVVGNLEGPVTDEPPVSDYHDSGPNHYRFTFATSVPEVLARLGVRGVTLANNHTLNFGSAGLAATKTYLLRAGIGYTGAPDDPYTPWRFGRDGDEVAVYAYDPWNQDDGSELAKRVAAEADTVSVVVLAHWGNEYADAPSDTQRTLARRFIDAGADLIVGSHPHVVQSKERYKNAWIYYSLGNFVFDQYFTPQVSCGAVLHATFSSGSVTAVSESFITLERDGRTSAHACKTEVPLLPSE